MLAGSAFAVQAGHWSSAAATVDPLDAPVVMVHGYHVAACPGSDVGNVWVDLYAALSVAQWKGPLLPVSFYQCDTDGVDITGYGPAVPAGAAPTITPNSPRLPYDDSAPIEQLAHDLAWFVHDTYPSTAVDLVGVSMGGLIVRYALAQVAAHNPDFPPTLRVAQTIAVATPFAGLGAHDVAASLCPTTVQCGEMASDSPFMTGLAADQGADGTTWTVLGSTAGCDIVPGASALALPAATRIDYVQPCYAHRDWLEDGQLTDNASITTTQPEAVTGKVDTAAAHSLVLMRQILMTTPPAPSQPGPSPTSSSPAPTASVPDPTVSAPPDPTASTSSPASTLSSSAAPSPTPSQTSMPPTDTIAPTAQLLAPSTLFAASRSFDIAYRGSDAGTGVSSYDVRYRTAAWDSGFTTYRDQPDWQRLTSTSFAATGAQGYEYCYSVRARDGAGNVSAWTGSSCAVAPLDDRALHAVTSGWQRLTNDSAYAGTVTQAARRGAQLRLSDVQLRRLALVVVECPHCGKVRIDLDGHQWRTVDTYSTHRRYGVVLVQPSVSLRTTMVTLTDVDGRYAIIDAISVAH